MTHRRPAPGAITEAWSIPAGDVFAGTVYRIRCGGQFNWNTPPGYPDL